MGIHSLSVKFCFDFVLRLTVHLYYTWFCDYVQCKIWLGEFMQNLTDDHFEERYSQRDQMLLIFTYDRSSHQSPRLSVYYKNISRGFFLSQHSITSEGRNMLLAVLANFLPRMILSNSFKCTVGFKFSFKDRQFYFMKCTPSVVILLGH